MKKKQWAQSFSLIDEKYVEEADPMRDAGCVSAVRRLRRRIITLAACAAAVLLGLILFIPYRAEVPDVSRYADSEYYAVIQRLNDGQVIKPRYRNNLDYLLSKTLSKTDGDDKNYATGGTGTANGGEARPETGAYRETTDNQVAGIVEGDLLKRTDTRIYYADKDSAMLRVYSVMGEDSALLGSFDLTQVTVYPCEMYLSADGRSVTLLCNGNGGNNQSMILLLDVTDPAAIRVTKQVSLSGTLVTSRLTGNGRTLLVVTSSRAGRRQDYSDPLSFVPGINRGDGQGMRPLTADCITVPAEMSGTRYSTLTALHAETLDVLETEAGAEGTFLNDLVMEEILGELRDIGLRDGISCTCGCRDWKLKINYSSVELFCARCGGALKLPAATMSDLEDLCCKPTLLIRGDRPKGEE